MTIKKSKNIQPLLILGVAFFIMGCSSFMTIKGQYKAVDAKLSQRDFEGAAEVLEKSKDKIYQQKDQVMYYLDVGMLYHYMGNYEQSNEFLTRAERAIEEYYTISITKAGLSLLLNDNATDYPGEDYENIYLNVFKAINYLHLNKFDDAFVEIRRIDLKLRDLEMKYKKLANEYNKSSDAEIEIKSGSNNFYNSALARYLSMIIYRAENSWGDARIDRDKIYEAFRNQANIYPFPRPNLDSAIKPAKKARLNIVSFSGRNPDKTAFTVRFKSDHGHIIIIPSKETEEYHDRIEGFASIRTRNAPRDLYIKMQFPVMKNFKSQIEGVQVVVSGSRSPVSLNKIESINSVAENTFRVKEPLIYLKTITRSLVKGIAAAEAKKNIRKSNKDKNNGDKLLGGLLSIATDVAVDISENADLRIAHFFPGTAYIGELDIDPGTYTITVEYLDRGGRVVFKDVHPDIKVTASGLNMLESFSLE